MTRGRVYPIFIPHLGCPFRCLFCNQNLVTNSSQVPSPEALRPQLEDWLPHRGDGEIGFFGGSFTCLDESLQERYLAVAADFVRQGRVGGIRVSTRPDGLGTDRLDLLRRYSVTTVEVGCQSFSAGALAASGRGHDLGAMLAGLARLRGSGLAFGLQLLPGLPGEDAAGAQRSLQRALEQHPAFLRIYPTLVLPGTGLATLYEQGIYRPLELEAAVELVAGMLVCCEVRQVPVVRIGLQGEPGWQTGEGVWPAGPYHPAFGQLAKSRVWLWLLRRALGAAGGREVRVPLRQLSDCLGHRRQNLHRLAEEFGPVAIRPDRELPAGTYRIGPRAFSRSREINLLHMELADVVND